VSAAVVAALSFLVESTTVVLVESTVVAVESVVEDEEEPLQAAKDTVIAKAKAATLNEFFMCVYILF